MQLREIDISDILFERLKQYGAIKWHKNKNHSFYIKFKDVRLGSIRIANHRGREKYHYTYEIFKEDKDIPARIEAIVNEVIKRSKAITTFDPEAYIVWDEETRGYKRVKGWEEYRATILKKKSL